MQRIIVNYYGNIYLIYFVETNQTSCTNLLLLCLCTTSNLMIFTTTPFTFIQPLTPQSNTFVFVEKLIDNRYVVDDRPLILASWQSRAFSLY